MIDSERERFSKAIFGTFEIYSKEVSAGLVKVWWTSLKPYSIDDVCSALTKHISDPDRGQYPPKPADIIRFLTVGDKEKLENLQGQAEMQWLRVTAAIRGCGKYETPKFKDPITGAVVTALGGWPFMCEQKLDSLQWVQKKFVATYLEFEKRPLEELPNNVAGLADLQAHKAKQAGSLANLEKGLAKFREKSA